MEELLALPTAAQYMSSEESEEEQAERGPRRRVVKKLSWERTKLRTIKAALDQHSALLLSPAQRRMTGVVSREQGRESQRPLPDSILRWAVRTPAADQEAEA